METVLRAAFIYLFLFWTTRALGKATLGQLNPFELVTLIVMGDLIQPAVTQDDESLAGGMLAVSTFAVLTVLLAWMEDRFPRATASAPAGPPRRRTPVAYDTVRATSWSPSSRRRHDG